MKSAPVLSGSRSIPTTVRRWLLAADLSSGTKAARTGCFRGVARDWSPVAPRPSHGHVLPELPGWVTDGEGCGASTEEGRGLGVVDGGTGRATPRPERRAPARQMQCSGRVTQTWSQRRPALVSFSFYSVRLEACLASRVSTGLVNAGTPSAPHGMRSALRALCYCCLGQFFFFFKSAPFAVDDERDMVASRSISGGLNLVLVLRGVSRCC